MNATKSENQGSIVEHSIDVTSRQDLKALSEYIDLEEAQAGPVFVQLPGQMGWIKVNNFSACDQCRTSHVKCSLSVTGGPCNHCKNRNQLCKVYGWVFNPECPAYPIYKPVLPPPPPGPSSPLCSTERDEYKFEWELLIQKLHWLQRDAPRKFRKRSSAMPWKDEENEPAPQAHSRKVSPSEQLESSGSQFWDKLSHQGSHLPKRPRASRGEIPNCMYGFKGEEPLRSSSQHRMSISFILAPCNSEQISRPSKNTEGFISSGNGWESRCTSLASSEAGWSTRSESRSPSLPALDSIKSLPKAMNSSNTSFRSPPVPHFIEKKEILSKFKEWRPPFNSSFIATRNCTLTPIQRI